AALFGSGPRSGAGGGAALVGRAQDREERAAVRDRRRQAAARAGREQGAGRLGVRRTAGAAVLTGRFTLIRFQSLPSTPDRMTGGHTNGRVDTRGVAAH